LGVIAVTRSDGRRWLWAITVLSMGAAAIGLATFWPWFRLIDVMHWELDRDYWFNPGILQSALGEWCVPGYVCGLAALARLDRDLVRTSLAGGTLATLLGISSFLTRSPVTARLPIAGTFLFAVATGVFLHHSGATSVRAWRERISALLAMPHRVTAETAAVLAVLLVVIYGLIPQMITVFREPWLARAYVARFLHKVDKQQHVRQTYDRVLSGVGVEDVVLSDVLTSWPVPSSSGKIVAAHHYELFVTDQPTRTADVTRFFSSSGTEAERIAIADKYAARWILLNRRVLEEKVFDQLIDRSAVVRREDELVLMDARVWRNSLLSRVATTQRGRGLAQHLPR
jgi:hypothetical protein